MSKNHLIFQTLEWNKFDRVVEEFEDDDEDETEESDISESESSTEDSEEAVIIKRNNKQIKTNLLLNCTVNQLKVDQYL